MALTVGELLGNFRLVECLGEGRTAVVYKAFQAALDRHVTLKVLKEEFRADPGVRMRFQQEARAAPGSVGSSQHPVHIRFRVAGR